MRDTLYDIASELRERILSSDRKEETASRFFSELGHEISPDDIIVLDDGTPVVRDDKGRDYDKEGLQKLKNGISEQLELFDSLTLQGTEDDGRDAEKTRGRGKGDVRKVRSVHRANPILRDGVSAYYSPEKGWNGKEQHPWTEPPLPSASQDRERQILSRLQQLRQQQRRTMMQSGYTEREEMA